MSPIEYSRIRSLLERGLPGSASHKKVRPTLPDGREIYHGLEPKPETRTGAVLVLLMRGAEGLEIVFTVRKADLKEHSGQISFPGGRVDEGEDVQQAALRECQEELGVNIDPSYVLGRLSSIYIAASDFYVNPIVAGIDFIPTFLPSDDEVEEAFSVPVHFLLDNDNLKSERREIGGNTLTIPFFHWQGHKIWGATAAILSEFLDLLSEEIRP